MREDEAWDFHGECLGFSGKKQHVLGSGHGSEGRGLRPRHDGRVGLGKVFIRIVVM